jgi:cyclohexyl-isocyanide hydratase
VVLVEERFVHGGNVWMAAGVSAGMDMMLAYMAHEFGDGVAGDIQLEAEYFPSGRTYGNVLESPELPDYLRRRG